MGKKVELYVDNWIKYHEAVEDDFRPDDYWPYVFEVIDWEYSKPERLWQFILTVYRRKPSESVISNLAAGPLEGLLSCRYGHKFIERVVALARRDKDFNYLLGRVWQNSMSEEIWQMIQAVRTDVL